VLLKDLKKSLCALILNLPHLEMDRVLPTHTQLLAMTVFTVMKECRRLHSAPELFPSAAARETFHAELQHICQNMRRVKNSLVVTAMAGLKVKKAFDPVLAKQIEGKWFRLNTPRTIKLPPFHPGGPKHPWNKWFDNSNKEYSEDGKHKKIIQRAPAVAFHLGHKVIAMYNMSRKNFLQVRFNFLDI
jgi:hypothetical protein